MNTNRFQSSTNMQYAGASSGWMAPAATKPTFWQRILGVRSDNNSGDQETGRDSIIEHTIRDSSFSNGPKSGVDVLMEGSKPCVSVPKPIRSPLEAFKDAITDGTRLFCEQNVHPLYVEDKQTKFRVTGIKMYIPKSKNELVAVVEQLPIDVRNRLARLRAQSAPGAAEQLVFDEDFFGITIDVEPTVMDGQYVSLIASWAGTNVDIKISFTGQYVTVKPPVETKSISLIPPLGKAVSSEDELISRTTAPRNSLVENIDLTSQKQGGAEKSAITLDTGLPDVARRRGSCETLLSIPQREKHGKDTYIPALGRHPVARLRLLAHGATKETVLDICADMLPFVIGREYSASGRFERGHNLGINGDDPSVLMVSREHLELRSFDRSDSLFQVVNHAINSNGSFHNGCPLPNLFSFKAAGRQNVIVLGGTSGPGTVRVVFEAI